MARTLGSVEALPIQGVSGRVAFNADGDPASATYLIKNVDPDGQAQAVKSFQLGGSLSDEVPSTIILLPCVAPRRFFPLPRFPLPPALAGGYFSRYLGCK